MHTETKVLGYSRAVTQRLNTPCINHPFRRKTALIVDAPELYVPIAEFLAPDTLLLQALREIPPALDGTGDAVLLLPSSCPRSESVAK